MLLKCVVSWYVFVIGCEPVSECCSDMQAEIQQAFRDYQSGRLQECS